MTSSRKHPPVCSVFIIHCYWLINHRILPVLQFFLSASHYHRYINTSMVPPLYLHRLGLALQSGSLVGDSRARRHGTICRGVCGEKRRDSSNGRETAAWLSVCHPNQHSMLIAVADRASGTSEVSMLYPLRPRPSHAVASIPEGLMIIHSHLPLPWLHHQNSWVCFIAEGEREFRDENLSSEL